MSLVDWLRHKHRVMVLCGALSSVAACDGSVGDSKGSAAGEDGGAANGGDDKSSGGQDSSNGGGANGTGRDTGGGANGADGVASKPACTTSLASRLKVTTVETTADIAYLMSGYDGFPLLDRVELAVEPSGRAQVAWMNAAKTEVHVTPLDQNLMRRGDDTVIEGLDFGGLVAHDDGFAVLTRREDPGDEVAFDESEKPNKAAVLIRYRDGKEAFTSYLTGTMGLDRARDFSNGLVGALRWNGKKYGAYFVIRGGKGHWAEGHYGDKFIYADDNGTHVKGGWGWNCSHNEGIRLLAESDRFTPVCFSDAYPSPGLNVVLEGKTHYLQPEQNWAGYTAGNFGSIVRLADGRYLIAFTSKGDGGMKATNDVPEIQPKFQTSDIALATLASTRAPMGEIAWLTNTQGGAAEFDVRIAPYQDGIVAIWQRIEGVPDMKAMPFGKSAGVFMQRFTSEGAPVGEPEKIQGLPGWNADIVSLPGGHLAWAYVLDERATDKPFSKPPALRSIKIARLSACE